eukprot:gene5555-6918_t
MSISSYVGFMIVWLKLTDDLSKVGFYSGYTLSAYNLAQIIGGYFWGRLSDNLGRKPFILMCCLVSGIGFTTSYPLLIVILAIQGLFYCNMPIIKSYIGETVESRYQVRAYVTLLYGITGLAYSMSNTVLSTWSIASIEKGGLSFSSKMLGYFNAINGGLDAIWWMSIISNIGFMIVWFKLTDDLSKVGYYSGYALSAFTFAQIFSGYLWGSLSDSFGRKPITILCSIINSFCLLGIGFTSSYTLLVIIRSIQGLFYCNLSIAKSYIGEVTDDSNQVLAYGYLTIFFGFGAIVGPLIGGFLIYPTQNIHWFFEGNQLFNRFPFLLPNLVQFILMVIAIIVYYFTIPETVLEKKKIVICGKHLNNPYGYSVFKVDNDRDQENNGNIIEKKEPKDPIKVKIEKWYYSSLFSKKEIIMTIILYGLTGLIFATLSQAISTWSIAPIENGGLSFSSKMLGIYYALTGIWSYWIQTSIAPFFSKRYGLINAFTTGTLISVFICSIFPLLQLFSKIKNNETGPNIDINNYSPWFWVLLVFLTLAQSISSQFMFVNVMALINNSTTSINKGSAFGLSNCMISLGRTIASVLGSLTLTWTLQNDVEPERMTENTSLLPKSKKLKQLLKKGFDLNQDVLITISLYGLTSVISTMCSQQMLSWGIVPIQNDGLSFSSRMVGISNAVYSISCVIVPLFSDILTKKFAPIRSFLIGSIIAAIIFSIFPFLHMASQINNNAQGPTLINNSTTQSNKATSFGLGNSLMSLGKAIADVLGSNLMSWSLNNEFAISKRE